MERGTTNPAPCCHLANDTDLLMPVLWAMAGDNKQIDLWPTDPFTRIDPNLIRLSHGHSTPSLKISCKSVWPFSRNVADKETKKERKKERNRPNPKTIPNNFSIRRFYQVLLMGKTDPFTQFYPTVFTPWVKLTMPTLWKRNLFLAVHRAAANKYCLGCWCDVQVQQYVRISRMCRNGTAWKYHSVSTIHVRSDAINY